MNPILSDSMDYTLPTQRGFYHKNERAITIIDHTNSSSVANKLIVGKVFGDMTSLIDR